MYKESADFKNFISPDCDRTKFIQDYLKKDGIEAPVIQIEGKNHVYVKFPLKQYNPMCRIKTVIAHYDRFAGSPGANDNSAAVFCMMEWAKRLSKRTGFHNIRLLFTDGEENGQNGINEFGAYNLAVLFKKLGITNEDVYVFDAMGRGTIPVLCESSFPKKMSRSFISNINKLEEKTRKILQKANNNKWFSLKTDYSDNAGFLVNGIPAVAITMLPSSEIDEYLKNPYEKPETWRMFHTKNDNVANLTDESFEVFSKILDELALTM